MNPPSEKPIKFLRLKQVREITGLARSTIYLFINKGTFPRPVKLGPRTAAWIESEVDAWAAERVALRDAEQVSS